MIYVGLGRRVQFFCKCGNDESRNREQHQRCYHPRRFGFESLCAVLDSAEKQSKSKNQQGITEYRTDKSGLNDMIETRAQGKNSNKKLRQVSKSRLQNACCAGSETAAELFRRIAHDHRQ